MLRKSLEKLFLIALATILTAFCFDLSTAAKTNNQRQNALIERQKAYFEAIEKRQYDFPDAPLADDYTGTHGLGVFDKTREQKDLRKFLLLIIG